MKVFKMGKSVQGTSHVAGNIPCQDACQIECLEDGTFVVAVADGHGSSKCIYSDKGARFAVEVFVDVIKGLFKQTVDEREKLIHLFRQSGSTDLAKAICKSWQRRIKKSYNALSGIEKKKGNELPEFTSELFGTTLLGLVIAHDFVYALQIGDGDMVFVETEKVDRIIESPKFLGTETYSLSNENPWKNAISYFQRFEFLDKVPCMFMVSTDGFANSFISDDEYFVSCKDYFNTILEYGDIAVQENLSEWLHQTSQEGSGDDITLAIVGVYEENKE